MPNCMHRVRGREKGRAQDISRAQAAPGEPPVPVTVIVDRWRPDSKRRRS
ncbi:MAG: hypothetical protein GQ526_12205 [Ardenticatenales bacterium]|nr:hypothetical protein [Ardenticatenales bacterium]